jgi:hypothetical protein
VTARLHRLAQLDDGHLGAGLGQPQRREGPRRSAADDDHPLGVRHACGHRPRRPRGRRPADLGLEHQLIPDGTPLARVERPPYHPRREDVGGVDSESGRRPRAQILRKLGLVQRQKQLDGGQPRSHLWPPHAKRRTHRTA